MTAGKTYVPHQPNLKEYEPRDRKQKKGFMSVHIFVLLLLSNSLDGSAGLDLV